MAGRFVRRLAAATAVVAWGVLPAAADQTGLHATHDLRKEGGRTCFTDHWHYGSGKGSSKKAATADAISGWASFVDLEYGSDWARFSRAASKGIKCTQGGGGWDCSVEARPCR